MRYCLVCTNHVGLVIAWLHQVVDVLLSGSFHLVPTKLPNRMIGHDRKVAVFRMGVHCLRVLVPPVMRIDSGDFTWYEYKP